MAYLDDELEAARLQAMKAVLKPDGEYFIRKLCRWYSKEFSTPLNWVEDNVPIDALFQTYYECHYEDMKEEDRDTALDEIILTANERKEKEKKEQLEATADAEFLKQVKAEAEESNKTPTNLDKPPEQNLSPIPNTPSSDSGLPVSRVSKSIKDIPPDIDIKFVDSDEFDKIDSWDLLGPVSKDG